ncbi:TorF family putative porin [Shewanella sp. GXUN23E]|uniref:TorF family putative porin n=1 Tax=Shewanella sp. GXUN23E TaxID=3422498 RepID=UPI003D7D07E4
MDKYFNKKRLAHLTGILLTGALLSPLANAGELSGEVGVANDYRFRGVSQTDKGFQVSGSLDYGFDSGFFIGAWASNVDFGPEDDTKIELDLYAGYAHEINDDVSVDVTLLRYNYLGETSDYDYFEGTVGADFYGFRAAYWYTNDYGGADLNYNYIELNYSWEFAENFSLDLHIGNNSGDAVDEGFGGSYIDYSIAVSTEFSGVGISVGWLDTDIGSEYQVKEDLFNTEGTVLVSASYAF